MTFSKKQYLLLTLFITLNTKGTGHRADRCESVLADMILLGCIAVLKQEAHLLHASTTGPLGRMLMMGVMVMMMGVGWYTSLQFCFYG